MCLEFLLTRRQEDYMSESSLGLLATRQDTVSQIKNLKVAVDIIGVKFLGSTLSTWTWKNWSSSPGQPVSKSCTFSISVSFPWWQHPVPVACCLLHTVSQCYHFLAVRIYPTDGLGHFPSMLSYFKN